MKQRTTLALLLALTGVTALSSWTDAGAATGLPAKAPPATFSTGAKQVSLADYRGEKVMLWMFSSWCSSCKAGLDALAAEQPRLAQAGLRILALRNHENGGYPGPSARAFFEQFGKPLLSAPNWVVGDVSPEMAARYNPRRYPDIYFLIDAQGMVRAVNSAPAATIDTILRFAKGS